MRSFMVVALLACSLHAAQVSEKENPFKKAKVGDWIEYRMTGPNMEGKTKMTITSKDDKEVAYDIESKVSFNGKEVTGPVQKQKIDLTKSYDPVVAANLKAKNATLEKEGEGNEKIKVGNKEYETKWTKLKSTTTFNNVTVVSDYKMWFSKDVPLSGMVKMETTVSNIATKVELVGFGSK
jgi:hypothetical protein